VASSVAVKLYDTHSAYRATILTNTSLILTKALKETGKKMIVSGFFRSKPVKGGN
jgi:hypothetical protein